MNPITAFWNQRASLGVTAGTQDLILKALEQRAIMAELDRFRPLSVLEVGCGRGELARLLHETCPGMGIVAIDNAEAMIQACGPGTERLMFQVGELRTMPGCFDAVITERMLINLPTWEDQHGAIRQIAAHLKIGGRYLMCEHSAEGLNAINYVRAEIGLPTIPPPWHNRYLLDDELASVTCLRLLRCIPFSSTYYFLSRIVHAKLAQDRGEQPQYDSPINNLALGLPVDGPYAQGRLWVWEKP